MMDIITPQQGRLFDDHWRPIRRFACGGATLGLGLGFVEAALLFSLPRFSGFLRPDVDFAIWFVAPLVDAVAGTMLGFVLGLVASPTGRRNSVVGSLIAFFGIGLAGAYLGWLLQWFRIGAGVLFPRRPGITTLIESFLIVFAAVLLAAWLSRPGAALRSWMPRRLPWRSLATMNAITVSMLACGLFFCLVWRPYPYSAEDQPIAIRHDPAPNIILVVLDTVRADHLSCYGYSRHTTPNIDAIASRGTRFENAYSPTSWTLASLGSIFTGLLPHQHGADWGIPINAGPWTLARILHSEGYETAGFSSNPFYGLGAAWRLSEGFDIYVDDSYSVRHNLAATFVGQSVLQSLYNRLVRYNQFSQRNAGDLNRDVMRWYRHRAPGRPFFLFINPMDAHRPYLPPPPYDRRFGEIPHGLLPRLIAPLKDGQPVKLYSSKERQAMIDGYDNSLAYLDHQLGNLLRELESQRDSTRTIVIITSDHGEGFGEHGTYDHGWNLYQDVLRVPLVIEGPGIPAGMHIASVVPNRQLFSTVLDLAGLRTGPVGQTSLTRFWSTQPQFERSRDSVVSELAQDDATHQRLACMSLVTSRWQYIRHTSGQAELFDLEKDAQEETSLAERPQLQATVRQLEANLKTQIASSVMPWYGTAYLTPLNQGRTTFIEDVSQRRPDFTSGDLPIGTAQDYFSNHPPSQAFRPNPAERDLLRSLPYH